MSTEFGSPGNALPPLPPAAPPQPYVKQVKSPGVALVLSLFPGLGQVYNGQPAKGLVFFFTWVGCIYGAAQVDPIPFAFGIPFVYLFNLVDAYRSACVVNLRSVGQPEEELGESPAWGGTLVALGLLLLANNLGWLRLAALQRYWPVLLIVAGAAMLYGSLQRRKDPGNAGPGA
jgi:TM2 domain-containing membrane protein YozV